MLIRVTLLLVLAAVCTATCATAAPSGQPRSAAADRALAHVRGRPAEFNVTSADLDDVIVSSETVSKSSGVTHVYLQQRYGGIDIANAVMTVNVARDGTVLAANGTFYGNLAGAANRPDKTLAAGDAIARAAKYVGVALAPAERRKIPAKRVYHPVTPESLRLAWQVEIEMPDGQHHWVLTIDAVSGDLLDKFDRVVSHADPERVGDGGAPDHE